MAQFPSVVPTMSFSIAQARGVLITGATGSFGRAFIKTLLGRFPEIRRIVVFSRDELKQYEMSQDPTYQSPRLRFFLGDVRDKERLTRAMEDVDLVVHAAALKQVPAAEYNPFEAIKTNILGAQNVIEASLDRGVKRVVALSTDKACAPINLYGATKLCSDKLFVAANNFVGGHDIRFCVVRYGNVMGSRGSVVPLFLRLRQEGRLPITDPRMTRFNISLQEGVELVFEAAEQSWGGEIYVPKIPSYRIVDVAEAIAPDAEHDMVGLRPGEKLHEEMITPSDSRVTFELASRYVILPALKRWSEAEWIATHSAKSCKEGFHYRSDVNGAFLSVQELRALIRSHVDPSFALA